MSAGRVGVGIGTGAAGGAAAGMVFGPIGAAIGGGIGAIGGLISGLSSSSEEAKQRKNIRNQRIEQAKKAAQDDYEARFAALTGLNNDPMYVAMGYEPFDPQKAEREAQEYTDLAAPEAPPDYGSLIGSLGSLGSSIGQQVRADDLSNQVVRMGQQRGNPWAAYAGNDSSMYGNADPYDNSDLYMPARYRGR